MRIRLLGPPCALALLLTGCVVDATPPAAETPPAATQVAQAETKAPAARPKPKPAAPPERYERLSPGDVELKPTEWTFMAHGTKLLAGSIYGLYCGDREIELDSSELQGKFLRTRRFGRFQVHPEGDGEDSAPTFSVTPSQKRALLRYCNGNAASGPTPGPRDEPRPTQHAAPIEAAALAPPPRAPAPPPKPAPAVDDRERTYSLTATRASIARQASYGDGSALFSGNIPPEASVRFIVAGQLVLASDAPLNDWEPYWGLSASFAARPSSWVEILVLENDIDDSFETIGRWGGTLRQLQQSGGRLRFGGVERLSFELEEIY